jgi:monothiol glutaredoxin
LDALNKKYSDHYWLEKIKYFSKISRIVKYAPMIIFIKGNQECPKDEDSRNIWEYMNDLKVKFTTFDVLSNIKIKQWLKFFTHWSTFPQVFVNGKFIGGSNILQKVISKDELLELLPSECVKTSAIEIIMQEWSRNFITVFMKGTPESPKDEYQKILIDALSEHNFKFGYVNVVNNPDLREQVKEYTNWTSYPQIFLDKKFYSGLSDFLDLLESGKVLSIIPTTEVIMDQMSKFKNLIAQSRLFVFFEGVPPQGLSTTTVQKIDNSKGKNNKEIIDFLHRGWIKYKFYDVSQDEDVREAAIKYSKWTTFPQIYYDGQLLGDTYLAMAILPTLDL